MGVVDDDPETVGVVDVEPSGIFRVGGTEGAQGAGDGFHRHALGVAGGDGGQGVGDVELGQAAQGRGNLVGVDDG